jgi:carboxyl-terminal processing protease
MSTFKDTPAEKAGLQPGDIIVAVDGESTKGWTSDKTALTIRGPKGTQVIVSVKHTSGEVTDYKLIRSTVQVESVTLDPPGGVLRDAGGATVDDIGYIQIREFSRRTAQELDDAIKSEIARGVKGLIIDVRFNGGGLLSTTLASVDLLLNNGTIAIQRDGSGRETVYSAKAGGSGVDIPLVMLQNRFSASASEIMTAALKDNGRATIIGEKSFGKGTVNTAKELDNGAAVYVSIAHWLTPSGALIDKVGVRPDIEVLQSDEDIDLRRDTQLMRAIDVLQAQVGAAP